MSVRLYCAATVEVNRPLRSWLLAVTAGTEVDMCPHAVALHLAGDDVQHAAHRIAPVEHRGGSAQHLHPFGHHRLVTVADRVTVDAVVLRMAVDEYQQLAAARSDAAQADASGGSRRYPVAHHGARGDEQSRYLLRHGG